MALYVDGFLLVLPKKKLAAYTRLSKKAAKVWMDHGALEYRECVGDDLAVKGMVAFPKRVQAKPSEAVVFSWIVYRSKSDRDRINKKVMADKRLAAMMTPEAMPFDTKRMSYGGFKVIVNG